MAWSISSKDSASPSAGLSRTSADGSARSYTYLCQLHVARGMAHALHFGLPIATGCLEKVGQQADRLCQSRRGGAHLGVSAYGVSVEVGLFGALADDCVKHALARRDAAGDLGVSTSRATCRALSCHSKQAS